MDREKYRIVVGYALSNDGLWRQHTWLIDDKDNTIDTTIPHQLYFGAILDYKEALKFAFQNIEDDNVRRDIASEAMEGVKRDGMDAWKMVLH